MINLLNNLVEKNKQYIKDGNLATYIPELAKVDPNKLGIAIIDLQHNNEEYCSGDYNSKFAIESIVNIPALMLAVIDNDLDYVFSRVNTEPTNFSFDSILDMQITNKDKPNNPFINAGAIVTTSLIKGANSIDVSKRMLDFIKVLTDNNDIKINEKLYLSEKETADINRFLAYYMKGNGILDGDVSNILDSYFRNCSIEIDALDLAKLGCVLSTNGILPWNDEKIISEELSVIIKALMSTCGLYDESGEVSVLIGVPSKSGVGGGILAVVPNKYSIGIFSPTLNDKGNSIAGIHLLKDLSDALNLDILK
ncbi:MAG: glutaminase A [Clostridium sp.]|uniref:glutaminase A n=1 Tax=Clostridium sp. TaxID=1506 RepID=UPI002FC74C2F